MSDKETGGSGDPDPLAKSRQVVAESKGGKTDEATRITRIVLVAVILVLVGGLALLLVFGPAGDNSAREAVGDLERSQVSIRDNRGDEAPSTSAEVVTDTAPPAETAPPETEAPADPGAPPPPPSPPSPPAAPNQPATTAAPARLEIFYAVDSQGRLPVRVGQGSQISIRNSGGSDGAWALNATGPLRVDGQTGVNGRVSGGSIAVVTVTVDPAFAPDSPTEATIRFDTPDGESRTIQVQISP